MQRPPFYFQLAKLCINGRHQNTPNECTKSHVKIQKMFWEWIMINPDSVHYKMSTENTTWSIYGHWTNALRWNIDINLTFILGYHNW